MEQRKNKGRLKEKGENIRWDGTLELQFLWNSSAGTFEWSLFSYKSERKQTGMTWIALLLILMNCYHTFWAAILNVIHIPVNIISMGIIDLLTGGLLWFFIVKKKKWQRYEFAIADAAFLVTALAIIAVFAKVRYGGMALNINFLTIDPANHFRAAMDLVDTGTVTSMFYETVLNGLLLNS